MRPFQETFEVSGSMIYGRADDINRIIELLSSEDGTNLNYSVVSIVADRGTGRSTLLHLLHSELCNAFDTRKFICMPEKFDEKGLMRVIIESLAEIRCDITDLEVLEETVKEELKDQRLLLLLDNFENKSQKCWDLILALLKVCKGKSAIVVTATREAVAKVKGPIQFYSMNSLSNEWCWMILEQGVFSGENPNADTELVDLGKRLVAKCSNVTLCIKVLSGVLRYSISADEWRAVLDNKFWEMDEVDGDVPLALRVCYEFLPSHLKPCFKYCSLFPKEYIFSKQHLVRLWLSQGFIEPGEGRELEDIGTEYFDQLLSLSFFQPSLIPGKEEDKFVMPGLIHDLARQFSKNECFQFEGCVQRAPENACHLSLVPHEFQSISLSQLIARAKNLQTVLVVSRSAFQHQNISSSILNLVHLKDLIVEFHSLITLNLNNTDIEELPESIGSLTKLRYLSLSSTNIKKIPLEISNLIHLQTLEANDCHYLEELPRSIQALTNLRSLDVTKKDGYIVMPRGIGKLTNLRSLATFNVGFDPLLHCGIEELKDMEHLKGCLEISGLVNVRSGIGANKAHMRSKEHIETLCFQWSDGMSFLEGEEGAEIAQEVLEILHPTDNLKEIIIRDYPGSSFPMWIECAAFTRLVSVIFDHCYNCERLPDLGGLPSLRFLSIQKMYGVQRMNLSGSERIPENIIKYPSLEQLTIWEMYELEEWVEIGNEHFPVLHSLCINKCPLLRNVPKFPALVELSVYSCAQFLEAMDLPSLESMRIECLQKTKPFRLPKDLVGLKKLEISHCPEPLSIEGLSLLNSLETIIIFRCIQLDAPDILDESLFTYEERGNMSVWLRKKKIDSSEKMDFVHSVLWDEQQQQPILSKKRKYRGDLYSLSGILAEGHMKIKELESQMSKEDLELVETTVQRLVETVQSSMANLLPAITIAEKSAVKSAILDSDVPRIQHSKKSNSVNFSSSSVGSSGQPSSVSGIVQPHTEGSEHLKVSKERGYYRCMQTFTQGCSATKQVQRRDDDPLVFDITYIGTHTCSDNAAGITVIPSQEPISCPESPTCFSFMPPMQDRSGHQQEEASMVDPLSSSAFEPIACQQDLNLSLSMSSGAISGIRWENRVASSPSSSSFVARSETKASDITALHSFDPPSSSGVELMTCQQDLNLSLSLSSVAISGPMQENRVAFSPSSSSSVARSGTEFSDVTALHSVDPPSCLEFELLPTQLDPTPSLSMSSIAISGPRPENRAAFSPSSSIFVGRSETDVSDITALHSVYSHQASHPEFKSELEDNE